MAKLVTNASVIIVAGSETTTTTLCGATYYLAVNPDKLASLCTEVRSAFTTEADMTLLSVSRLEYMTACLEEALRLYPPISSGIPRIVPTGGRMICGHYVPANASTKESKLGENLAANNFGASL